jgi:transitional endoplasmic reticulum ATPase
MPLADDVNLEELSRNLEGFVGSDIQALCREAGLVALREDIEIDKVSYHHFLEAREKVHATMTAAAQEYYEKIEMEIKKDSGQQASRRYSNDFT